MTFRGKSYHGSSRNFSFPAGGGNIMQGNGPFEGDYIMMQRPTGHKATCAVNNTLDPMQCTCDLVGRQAQWDRDNAAQTPTATPIDMILFCPRCGQQHIDGAEPPELSGWTNPPHRSHFCSRCRYIWRPADVPTNGVAEIKTKGAKDQPYTLHSDIGEIAKAHHHWCGLMGWNNAPVDSMTNLGLLMLIVSECGEAANETRGPDEAPTTEKFGSELADIVLRTCHLALQNGVDLGAACLAKIKHNWENGKKKGRYS